MHDDLIIEKKVVVGHIARHLPKQVEFKTHHWEVFVYSSTGEDLTKWVDKVVFHLHQSFQNPTRECTREPYFVSEDGWGEFEVSIDIYPRGSDVTFSLSHLLRFPGDDCMKPLIDKKEALVVFRNPSPILYEGLTAATFSWNKLKRIKKQLHLNDAEEHEIPTSDYHLEERWLNQIYNVSQDIRNEIQGIADKNKIQLSKIQTLINNIQKYSPEMAELASLFI